MEGKVELTPSRFGWYWMAFRQRNGLWIREGGGWSFRKDRAKQRAEHCLTQAYLNEISIENYIYVISNTDKDGHIISNTDEDGIHFEQSVIENRGRDR